MNLQEMLDYTASQYLDDRTSLVDGDPDSLWSDEFLVRQLNEAMRKLVRRAWCIIDEGHAVAGRIALVTGKAVYDLHKSVLRVYFATPTDQTWPLWRTSDAVLRGACISPADAPFNIDSPTETGRPVAMATDVGIRQMRVFRTPTVTENGLVLNLKVARLPVVWLTVDDLDAEPEAPEDYHELMCRYAAGRALTLPNVDGAQKAEGRALIAEFNDEVREARQDRQRAEMEPSRPAFSSVTALLDR
jgi:hypothetical protein